ncbi:hypothetical protein M2324_003796 [Rhodovulum sulfidophilum]|uniref:hypothetical protein n=1 Tax=Rhodovulum sulfidophilum TaxID=35806 RepID=UPI0005A5E420|nr:hypothetical protein [Rhodovulum sulfidophilum]ANB34675.1 hypothetical protein A6W98_11745 [Rhodovulum sulfidophilum DSM 1374]ANB38497.1 hypothetical protein A6024_11610 [Rhodovulum sulfidophilum]MCW2305374.1 hypothetical protein [Rhodovulum sulfidophilum]
MDPYENLSEDNHVAFLQLEKEFRNELEAAQEDQNSSWSYIAADYMNKTLAAAYALDVDALSGFSVNTRDNNEHFNDFLRAVDNVIIQMRIANSRSRNAMSVGLTEAQKTKIHHFIEKIRREVDSSSAPDSKKDKLYDILAKLAQEVSKARTRYERFADLARSLAGLSADVEREGARPWWPWFEKIMGVLDDAKEAEPSLPKPPEIKKIEPPRKELPKPDAGYGGGRDLDDEIPF